MTVAHQHQQNNQGLRSSIVNWWGGRGACKIAPLFF